jgi:hypothetical protein
MERSSIPFGTGTTADCPTTFDFMTNFLVTFMVKVFFGAKPTKVFAWS